MAHVAPSAAFVINFQIGWWNCSLRG